MIVGLRWEETSGVDHPANEEEGWVVMKSADGDDGHRDEDLSEDELTQLAEDEREALEKVNTVVEALDSVKAQVGEASKDVQEAFAVLVGWTKELGVGASEDADDSRAKAGIVRQILNRIINRRKAPETYATSDIAAAIKGRAGELVQDLAKIINDKDLTKDDKARQVTEVVKTLQEAVEAELKNSNKEDTE